MRVSHALSCLRLARRVRLWLGRPSVGATGCRALRSRSSRTSREPRRSMDEKWTNRSVTSATTRDKDADLRLYGGPSGDRTPNPRIKRASMVEPGNGVCAGQTAFQWCRMAPPGAHSCTVDGQGMDETCRRQTDVRSETQSCS